MGGDHGHKVALPDYKVWKYEGTPLETVQQRLAKRGLRDPWLRNEAWRFTGQFGVPVKLSDVLLRGFKKGFVAFAVCLAVEYALFPPKKSEHH
ncbi:NADH dehydrogenase [ubiquinone] 1 beta subcomplex subunit 3 [Engraulis encrasicolus]|uniref:NADH dehydrogenase [ubiquinone] 1 beta subcomplex subunit 3 n=1 Tax=Engraulis encrasicolus TaxID=184585 RepID=UPI002FD586F1